MKKIYFILTLSAFALGAAAQNANLVLNEGVTIHTLGDAKTWTKTVSEETVTETFNVDNLTKIITEGNKQNVYLFPEGGWNTPENREIGIQGFYVDLGQSYPIGSVTTTWEGAAANSFEIYVTDQEPTIDILETEATYTATGLGQYQLNIAELKAGVKGRYVVFQSTDATNYDWGVKIQSMSIAEPTDYVLTTFTATPGIIALGEETTISFSFTNQLGTAIAADDVTLTATAAEDGEISFEDGKLTIISGAYAVFDATYNDVTLSATVFAATPPAAPITDNLTIVPLYMNGDTDDNGTIEWTVDWNGGAINNGQIEFPDGEVAWSFGNTRCVFFNNTKTTGSWNNCTVNPAEEGLKTLQLDVFSSKTVQGTIEFEGVTNLETGHTYNFNLEEGKWNNIGVDIEGATKLNNLSIRFNEENMCDILISNIYFSSGLWTGIESVTDIEEADAPAVYYNLQGQRVEKPGAGIYICRQGQKTQKILIK